MAIEIKMPALSPTMEEGTLAKWLVKEGDTVKSGDIMAEIETDKATMEFEAVDEGTIGKIVVAEGTDNVKVGTVIATMLAEGEERRRRRAAPAPRPRRPRRSETPSDQKAEARRPRRRRPRPAPRSSSQAASKTATSPIPRSPRAPRWSRPRVREALRDAMAEEMRADDRVFVMGEEVARISGRVQGHAGPARRVRRRSASSTRRSPNMALPASAPARRWAGCGRSSSS